MRVDFTSDARQMILEQADYFGQREGTELERRWTKAIATTIKRIGQFPNSGVVCAFRNRKLAELRRIPVDGFQRHLIFYRVEAPDHVLVVSVMHGARHLERVLKHVSS